MAAVRFGWWWALVLTILCWVFFIRVPLLFTAFGWWAVSQPFSPQERSANLHSTELALWTMHPIPQASVRLVNKHSVGEFEISRPIRSNGEWLQRITEGAFPRRVKAKAAWKIQLPDEALTLGCDVRDSTKEVVLVYCP